MAGLLDSLFDTSNYGGDNSYGGLLARLKDAALFNNPNALQAPVARGPINPIAVGNVQMPRLGNAAQYQPQPDTLPPQVANANAQAPAQVDQTAQPAFMQANQPGFAPFVQSMQAHAGLIPSIIAGVTGQRFDPVGIQQQNLNAQFQATRDALIANGVPARQAASTAMLSVLNPEAAKTVLPEMLTTKEKFQKIGSNPVTGDQFGFVNEREQTINGKPLGAGGSGVGSQMLATGVQQYNPDLTGEAYLRQFSPEVQAATKAYINGDVMPTGNPRQQGIANAAKTIAQKYGADMGIPVSDALYNEKRKIRTDLGSSSNSSMGGILSNGESSFAHLAEASKSMAAQGNVSHDFPLGGKIAYAQNYLNNDLLAGSDTRAKIRATDQNLSRYGQESTKFYAATGGGEGERTQARRDVASATTSSEEQAAFLEKEKELMLDRLNGKFNQIRSTLGEEEGNREIAKHMPDIQKNIAILDANIAKLREGPQTQPAAPKAAPKPGTIQGGYKFKGGNPADKNNWEPIS